ncbi:MAG TPA: hypothetical protein VHW06_03190 [Streptosporangiaceae bacterium]|jgi:hypothetical protein|nr:hypothetical protein [Streptosporangiaceae bacterium]
MKEKSACQPRASRRSRVYFPAEVDAILSTYALTQVPECAGVIAHGAAALSAGGRWAVLDLKVPGQPPGWLAQLGTAFLAAGSSQSGHGRAPQQRQATG